LLSIYETTRFDIPANHNHGRHQLHIPSHEILLTNYPACQLPTGWMTKVQFPARAGTESFTLLSLSFQAVTRAFEVTFSKEAESGFLLLFNQALSC
jgi:hypothetical protein